MRTACLVDPEISRKKFEREIASFRRYELTYSKRGIWLVRACFPEAFFIFGISQVKPPAIAFGALFNFVNFDLWAPSVKLADPFTRIPYRGKEAPNNLLRRVPGPNSVIDLPPGMQLPLQAILQAHDPEDVPFLCLPGIREYHEHPAHSGDPWLLHRRNGECSLLFVVDQLFKYGVAGITGFQVGIQVNIQGFIMDPQP